MSLEEHFDGLVAETAFWMVGLDNPECPLDQMGPLCENVSRKLRALGIISLLMNADTNLFCHNLIRSGVAYEQFLSRASSEKYVGFALAISRNGAFFDCLAAAEFALASRLVRLSSPVWIPEGEYEDDFCYVRSCHLLLNQDDTPSSDVAELLVQFETALEGDSSVRFELVQSLLACDQGAFDAVFDQLIEDYQTQLEDDQERGRLEEPEMLAERNIFVEGLAILRLAERRGLQTRSEYEYCPALARLPMTIPFPGE